MNNEFVGFRLPKNLIDEIDARVTRGDYMGGSEFIRESIRKNLVE